ncbi:MAG: hypothetical protein KDD94_12680, partial [Calditrichaeota bacterium]|nr:hypothetical protein [Calditrichota bacterium]
MSDTTHFITMLERIKNNRQNYNIIEINNAIHQVESHFKAANIKQTTLKHFIHTFDYNTLFDS